MIIRRPSSAEYPEYFEQYIRLVPGDTVLKKLQDSILDLQSILSNIPEEKENFAYAPDKWSVKDVIGHIIDTERILAYRALRFARNDKVELPGYDQNIYAPHANYNKRTLYDIAHEFGLVRESNILLFRHFDEEALMRRGRANKWDMTVRSLIYVISGHELHHLHVLRTRYLPEID
ncbi:MAG: DinB family protein [Bacteroidota bacterium]